MEPEQKNGCEHSVPRLTGWGSGPGGGPSGAGDARVLGASVAGGPPQGEASVWCEQSGVQ